MSICVKYSLCITVSITIKNSCLIYVEKLYAKQNEMLEILRYFEALQLLYHFKFFFSVATRATNVWSHLATWPPGHFDSLPSSLKNILKMIKLLYGNQYLVYHYQISPK